VPNHPGDCCGIRYYRQVELVDFVFRKDCLLSFAPRTVFEAMLKQTKPDIQEFFKVYYTKSFVYWGDLEVVNLFEKSVTPQKPTDRVELFEEPPISRIIIRNGVDSSIKHLCNFVTTPYEGYFKPGALSSILKPEAELHEVILREEGQATTWEFALGSVGFQKVLSWYNHNSGNRLNLYLLEKG
jgi:hypothetical protein